MKDKYQEALDNICCGCYGGNEGCNGKDKYCLNYLTLQELVDKEKPMKLITKPSYDKEHTDYHCPKCNARYVKNAEENNYCYNCGQKLDWSDKE